MPNGTYGGVRGKGAQAKRSRSPTYSILNIYSIECVLVLLVLFGLTLAFEHCSSIASKSTHLILTRETIGGSKEVDALAQLACEVVAMCHATSKQDGVDLTT